MLPPPAPSFLATHFQAGVVLVATVAAWAGAENMLDRLGGEHYSRNSALVATGLLLLILTKSLMSCACVNPVSSAMRVTYVNRCVRRGRGREGRGKVNETGRIKG